MAIERVQIKGVASLWSLVCQIFLHLIFDRQITVIIFKDSFQQLFIQLFFVQTSTYNNRQPRAILSYKQLLNGGFTLKLFYECAHALRTLHLSLPFRKDESLIKFPSPKSASEIPVNFLVSSIRFPRSS